SQSAEVVVKEIGRINSEMNKTVIVVTHDPHVASHCNRVIFLKDGEVLDIMDKQVSKTLFYDEILRMMQMI
ncbi:MAG TPA: ABC transporter ATP-binding protein, partial [Epulopiscium sp.]|nr:ABC transporter ATP-binding protein [Candidatus Epulonipiscium sp.]